jgi:hypothetical protein
MKNILRIAGIFALSMIFLLISPFSKFQPAWADIGSGLVNDLTLAGASFALAGIAAVFLLVWIFSGQRRGKTSENIGAAIALLIVAAVASIAVLAVCAAKSAQWLEDKLGLLGEFRREIRRTTFCMIFFFMILALCTLMLASGNQISEYAYLGYYAGAITGGIIVSHIAYKDDFSAGRKKNR